MQTVLLSQLNPHPKILAPISTLESMESNEYSESQPDDIVRMHMQLMRLWISVISSFSRDWETSSLPI